MTRVANIHKERGIEHHPDYVYVGRGRGSPWGNPFFLGRDGSRDEVIRLYHLWLTTQRRDLVRRARRDLRGKILGCFCAPLPCHADVLAAIADDRPWSVVRDSVLADIAPSPILT